MKKKIHLRSREKMRDYLVKRQNELEKSRKRERKKETKKEGNKKG
jgi:hypothetical protein